MKKLIASALIACAFSASAFAASNGDIILGFYASGGQGSSTNLEVNLGSVSTLKSITGTQTLVNLTNDAVFGANGVNDVYGASWNSRSDLFGGFVGAVANGQTGPGGEVGRTLWAASNADESSALGVKSAVAYNSGTSLQQGNPTTDVLSVYNSLGSQQFQTIGTSIIGSWSLAKRTPPLTAFEKFAVADFDIATNITGDYVSADLFEMVPGSGAGTYLGTLAIWANGDVTFSTLAAIPEPSTYALILGGLVLGFVAYRRRQQIQA